MLTVEDDEFWTDVEPLEINGLPAMQESVTVVGFPTGGDNVCVTKGVVSRLDRQSVSIAGGVPLACCVGVLLDGVCVCLTGTQPAWLPHLSGVCLTSDQIMTYF